MAYLLHIGILVALYLILAQSLNITLGLGRMFNLAHVACYAIGAYTTALLATLPTEPRIGFFSCVLSSMLLAGLLALLVGFISLRLSEVYFAMGSLAFSSIVSALLVNWKSVTRGVLGIPDIPRPHIGQLSFSEIENFALLVGGIALLVQLSLYLLIKSPFGRSLRAIAEAEYVALSLGSNVRLIKSLSFFISSLFAGLAGSLFAYYLNYIDPSSFSLPEMVFVLTIVIVGKPGSFWGVMLACIFLVGVLPEGLRFLPLESSVLGPLRQLIYGTILFTVVFYNRERIFPIRREV